MDEDGELAVHTNVVFAANTAGLSGGAIGMDFRGVLDVRDNVVFMANTAGADGGAVSLSPDIGFHL